MEVKQRISQNLPSSERSFVQPVIVPIVISAIVIIVTSLFLLNALIENGQFCFPLDDPWIHLTFARNLLSEFRFFYVKDGPSIQASTSPLFTILLTPIFMVGFNEYLITYFWGICGVIGLVWGLYYTFRNLDPVISPRALWIISLMATLVALDRRILWVSLSGMETTCFIGVIVGARSLLANRKYQFLGLSLALISVWLRPEGIVFVLIVITTIIVDHLWLGEGHRSIKQNMETFKVLFTERVLNDRRTRWIVSISIIGILGYFSLNAWYNGTLWPSTMAAKVTGYSAIGNPDYFRQVLNYLTYAGIILLVPGFLWSLVETVIRFWRRQSTPVLVDLLWFFTLVLLYYWKLPYVRQHGRYILPVLPFMVVAGVYGSSVLITHFTAGRQKVYSIVFTSLLLFVLIWQASKIPEGMTLYSQQCNYYFNRHVAAARWIKANTPETAIIGTHDIGALGFLSDRKLVDMAGLVDPEIVPHLHDNAYIKQWLIKRNVDFIAILNTWYTVINVNPTQIYAPDPGEVLSIFPLVPRLKFMERSLIYYYFEGEGQYRERRFEESLKTVNTLLLHEPQFAAGYVLKAKNLFRLERFEEAEQAIERALHYQPDHTEAYYQKALINHQRGNGAEALFAIESALKINPNYYAAIELKRTLEDNTPESH